MKIKYRLLNKLASLFEGQAYRHRVSNQNDLICVELFEDLLALGKSAKLTQRIQAQERVVNTANKRHGVVARRGDGTFGELVPGEVATVDPAYAVPRGIIATMEVGAECKILSKAMIKQIDRVMKDLREQVNDFKKAMGNPITVAVVGVNHADYTVSYENDRIWKTGVVTTTDPITGKTKRLRHPHPIDEAPEAIRRVMAEVAPHYDETLILRYKATNEAPFPFDWVDPAGTERDYGALLTRVSREYDRRF